MTDNRADRKAKRAGLSWIRKATADDLRNMREFVIGGPHPGISAEYPQKPDAPEDKNPQLQDKDAKSD